MSGLQNGPLIWPCTLSIIIILQKWHQKMKCDIRLCLLRWARAIARYSLPQTKLRRAVYCSPPTIGKSMLYIQKSSPRALLEHPRRATYYKLSCKFLKWQSPDIHSGSIQIHNNISPNYCNKYCMHYWSLLC